MPYNPRSFKLIVLPYKEIVKEAWETTHDDKTLFPFGFIPSIFGMIVGVIYVAYQISAFRHSQLFAPMSNNFDYWGIVSQVWGFMTDNPSAAAGIIFVAFFIVMMYVFSPVIAGGALIDLITKKVNNKPMRGGFAEGLRSFFPLFEFAAITAPFGIVSYFTELSLVLRNFGTGTWVFVIPILTGVFFVGIFLNLLFIFSEQFIVLERDNVLQAMKKSAFLVLTNVRDIFFLGITMLLIVARIFMNMLLILLIPILFILIVTFMASVAMKWVGVLLGVAVGLTLLIAGSYLLAGFHIFAYAVWTLSFIRFRKKELEDETTGIE